MRTNKKLSLAVAVTRRLDNNTIEIIMGRKSSVRKEMFVRFDAFQEKLKNGVFVNKFAFWWNAAEHCQSDRCWRDVGQVDIAPAAWPQEAVAYTELTVGAAFTPTHRGRCPTVSPHVTSTFTYIRKD